MKLKNKNKAGLHPFLLSGFLLLLWAGLMTTGCSGDKTGAPVDPTPAVQKSPEEIADQSMKFSGHVLETTCLECHPSMAEGEFNIDLEKVKSAGMMRGKNMDIPKPDKKETKN